MLARNTGVKASRLASLYLKMGLLSSSVSGGKIIFKSSSPTRSNHNRCSASHAAKGRHKWLLVEDIAHHVGQFLNQPVLSVVVVQHNQAVTSQVRPSLRKCVLCEQETFETQTGIA